MTGGMEIVMTLVVTAAMVVIAFEKVEQGKLG